MPEKTSLRGAMEALELVKEPIYKDKMARFGIVTDHALGMRIPVIRKLAKEIGKDHELALSLWETQVHEARLLASLVADPTQMTEATLERWVQDFYSWDLVDQVCT
ncbi:MAG: DNA alkylation repair protein, partial [Bacteroidota bacterium]